MYSFHLPEILTSCFRLGGKKRKNETAASKWLERVRSREDELKVSTDLESQINESLSNRISGASRRHIGIGFKEEPPQTQPSGTEGSETTPTSTVTSTIPPNGGSLVNSLSQRANVPSLSSRAPRLNNAAPGYGPPMAFQGHYRGPPPNSMYPQNYNTGQCNPHPPPQNFGYGMPPQMQNCGYGNPYQQSVANYGYGYPRPPMGAAPQPPPPPPPDEKNVKPPEPKTKSSFYAQFKKAS